MITTFYLIMIIISNKFKIKCTISTVVKKKAVKFQNILIK